MKHLISIPKLITSVLNSDKTGSVGGESSPISTMGESAYVKRYSRAFHEESSLPLSITNCKEQISNGSPRQNIQSSRLLQEVLMMTAENSCDSGEEIVVFLGIT